MMAFKYEKDNWYMEGYPIKQFSLSLKYIKY